MVASVTRERKLWSFLVDRFTREELERLAKLDFPDLQHELPGMNASSGSVAESFIAAVCERGAVSELFVVLIRERPSYTEALALLRAQWHEVAEADDPTVPRPKPPSVPREPGDGGPSRAPEPRYPLLSEWDAYPAGRWLLAGHGRRVRRLSWLLIAGFLLCGLLTLVLARMAGAACLEVSLASAGSDGWFVYGYMAEFPHGLWYLSGAPLFVFAFGAFVVRATDYLRSATKNGRLVVVDPSRQGPSALQWFAAANRRVFRTLTGALFLLACGIVGFGEYASWDDRSFGWVQAQQAALLVGSDLGTLEGVAILPIEADLCPTDRSACTVTAIAGATRDPSRLAWFVPFVGFALTIQVLFVFVCLYTMAKLIFFIGVHVSAITGTGRLRLRLDFHDPNRRMGLRRLDEPLFAALWLAALGGFWSCLVALSNNEKGSRFFLSGPALVPANLSHGVGFVINIVLWLAVFGVPLWYFDYACHRARVRERARLDQLRLAASPLERADLDGQLQRVEEQRARPHEWPILALGWSVIVLSILLPTLLWTGSNWRPVAVVRSVVARQLPRGVCHVFGGLPRAPGGDADAEAGPR